MSYTKKCPKCPNGVIHRRGSFQCRSCHLKSVSPWDTESDRIEHIKKRRSDWFQKNKKRLQRKRKKEKRENPLLWKNRELKYHLKKMYGITYEKYIEMVDSQNSKCMICGVCVDKLHVDHNHITKQIRGLLCFNCNGGLGQFKDNLTNLKNAVQYLESYETSDHTKNSFNSTTS